MNLEQAEGRETKLERQEETWRKIRPEVDSPVDDEGTRGDDLFHSFSKRVARSARAAGFKDSKGMNIQGQTDVDPKRFSRSITAIQRYSRACVHAIPF